LPLDKTKLEKLKHTLSASEIDRLDLYVNEANFMYSLIEEDLDVDPIDFYEIGSGIGLLSRMVAEKGHNVIATEPATSGFGVVKVLQKVIEESFVTNSKTPIYYSVTAEELFPKLQEKNTRFDYIFCANVVEHVADIQIFFDSTLPLLSQEGLFRFVCPNYAFPYEPHFGFLTIFSKKWTLKIQKKKIRKMEKERKENLQQFYDELSFPNIQKINKKLNKKIYKIEYSKLATLKYIKRATNDNFFKSRKRVISMIVRRSGKILLFAVRLIPKSILPIIDGRVTKSFI
jgi:2-polyprenyl-3-methyl-5-hydroxy-6-metoxy-1,4-benzoquinol methylase